MALTLDAKASQAVLYDIPEDIKAYLKELDEFIEREIKPLQEQDDNIRFFDHRREWARTDYENDGLPRKEWEDLLKEMRRRADKAGHYRFPLPKEYGGRNGSNLAMAVIREHLAHKGLGLHNDLQNESSIVGNMPTVLMFRDFGTPEQKAHFIPKLLDGSMRIAFGLTEPHHGSDATWMETQAVRDGDGWKINGMKMWNTGLHVATHDFVFARTSGKPGDPRGITCFIVPTNAPGFIIEEYLWTIRLKDVWVPANAFVGEFEDGLALAQHFVHENRIRQAASSLGAAQYCIDESVKYAKVRKPFGKPLSANQAIQWPLVEHHTEAAMLRLLIRQTAAQMDTMSKPDVAKYLSDKVAMCNYRANRLVCEAADRAMQIHGGMGYSRHKPFEHIYRHHRRYRITEGSEEIQMRRVAQYMFAYNKEIALQREERRIRLVAKVDRTREVIAERQRRIMKANVEREEWQRKCRQEKASLLRMLWDSLHLLFNFVLLFILATAEPSPGAHMSFHGDEPILTVSKSKSNLIFRAGTGSLTSFEYETYLPTDVNPPHAKSGTDDRRLSSNPQSSASRQRSNSLAPASPVERVFGSERAWMSFHDRYIKGWEIGGGSKDIPGAKEFLETTKAQRATKSTKRRGAETWGDPTTLTAITSILPEKSGSAHRNQLHQQLLLQKSGLRAHAGRNKSKVAQFVQTKPEYGEVVGRTCADGDRNMSSDGTSDSEDSDALLSRQRADGDQQLVGMRSSAVWPEPHQVSSLANLAADSEHPGRDSVQDNRHADVTDREFTMLDDMNIGAGHTDAGRGRRVGCDNSRSAIPYTANVNEEELSMRCHSSSNVLRNEPSHPPDVPHNGTSHQASVAMQYENTPTGNMLAEYRPYPWEPLSLTAAAESPRSWVVFPSLPGTVQAPQEVSLQYVGKMLRKSNCKYLKVEHDVYAV
ncbi:hypothetical protein HDU93_006670 [Gonapodya sp. JEL0774]|nr:hypothetical protein HDU93_006670 [Gonapodya sp. JEL0774]